MPKNRIINRPIIMGIVGDSAAGKTTLTRGVSKILGEQNVATLCMDDYHRYDRMERKQNGMNPLDPECNFLDILEQDLAILREHKPILKPIYNHDSGCLERPEYLEPKPYVIVEGLFGFHSRAMRDNFDVKIYLKLQESLRIEWKVDRDTKKRGYVPKEVEEELKKTEFLQQEVY